MIKTAFSIYLLTAFTHFANSGDNTIYPRLINSQQFDHILQDREDMAFETMMSELARVHKEVFQLPFSYDHIKSVFMPEIESKRQEIAPHYPSRAVTGDNQELVMSEFRNWFDTYPMESQDYIRYVDQFIKDHK